MCILSTVQFIRACGKLPEVGPDLIVNIEIIESASFLVIAEATNIII